MKLALIAMCCFLMMGIAISEPVNAGRREAIVENFQVLVTLKGKPIEGASVEFYQGGALRYSVLTNNHGIAVPGKLPFGDYDAVVNHDEDTGESLLLHVVENGESTILQINLVPAVVPEIPEDLPAGDQVRALKGIITDVAGAVIPGAKVRVVRRTKEHAPVLHMKADAVGQFSGALDEGSYVALVFAFGFQAAVVPFEITKSGSGDLRIKLQVGKELPTT